MKAVKKHTKSKWVILYIERWLQAPMQLPDGTLQKRECGVPQGGVVSPLLSNLFLHYVFDVWMGRKFHTVPWCRYADDGLAHCRTKFQAEQLLVELQQRFKQCGLELHPDKTKIIYCKDGSRKGKYPNTEFNFLGYCFRTRLVKNSKRNSMFLSFTPSVSKEALKSMRATTRKWNFRNRSDFDLEKIAELYNPILRGWIAYYGRYNRTGLYPVFRHFNNTLKSWYMHKYNRFRGRKTKTSICLEEISKRDRSLFAHWKLGMVGGFA